MLKDIQTIYFDYDGTIHNSVKIYSPAFKKAYDFLVDNNKAEPRVLKEEEISKWLGYTSAEMWKSFMEDLEEPFKRQASQIIGEEMLKQIRLGNAELYPNALKVLKALKDKEYKLIFLSNCSINYMEASVKRFNLDRYFDGMHCAESYHFEAKHQILARIKGMYPDNQVIIGDRFHDVQSGVKNNIASIWCEYGFGKAEEANGSITSIKEISNLLDIL